MKIHILHGLKGARNACGIAVVIDVFRAFSLECYMYARKATEILPCGTVEEAFSMKRRHPGYLLAGERNGVMVEGFDYGNSPSQFEFLDLTGKSIIHTTSAGVQGLVAASHAQEVVTGALCNASAVAEYILSQNPENVSLVAMGWNGVKQTEEDTLCAKYICSVLEGKPMADIHEKALALREQEGKKFFDPSKQSVFPERDFWLCTKVDVFDHVIHIDYKEEGISTRWVKH